MLIKICCISSEAEARLAISHGVDALGLVSHMPSGPGVIAEETIAEIAGPLGEHPKSVLLTSLDDPVEIADQYQRCRVNAIQLCRWLDAASRKRLRAILPHAFLMQVIHVTGPEAVVKAEAGQEHVDALLLDSGTLAGETIELGGTGRTHNWSLSREIVREVDCPVFLAGGLNPANVTEAIAAVAPAGVDICSGVRTDGRLDPSKLAGFVAAIR